MSSEPAATQEKVKLTQILAKVEQIAAGLDKNGVLPSAANYDNESAPPPSMRWCAAILRVFLLRVIEHIRGTRDAVRQIQEEVFGRKEDKENGKPAIPSLKDLREQMNEMSKLMGMIVEGIKKAQAEQDGAEEPAQAATSEEPTAEVASNGNGAKKPTQEDITEAARMAEIDALAAADAATRGITVAPAPPVASIGGKKKKNAAEPQA